MGIGIVEVRMASKIGTTNSLIRCLDWICGGRTKMKERKQ